MAIGLFWLALNFALLLFAISLLWRMTEAQEKIARHLLEIVRDNKRARHAESEPIRAIEEED